MVFGRVPLDLTPCPNHIGTPSAAAFHTSPCTLQLCCAFPCRACSWLKARAALCSNCFKMAGSVSPDIFCRKRTYLGLALSSPRRFYLSRQSPVSIMLLLLLLFGLLPLCLFDFAVSVTVEPRYTNPLTRSSY